MRQLKQLTFDDVRRKKNKDDYVVVDESNEFSESCLDSGECSNKHAKCSDKTSNRETDDDLDCCIAEASHHNEVADLEDSA